MIAGIGYRLAPGCCHVCRSSDAQVPTIDTRREDPGDVRRSNVYICERCVRAMAQQLKAAGLTDWETIDTVTVNEMGAAHERWVDALERAERAEGLLRQLAELLPGAAGIKVIMPAGDTVLTAHGELGL